MNPSLSAAMAEVTALLAQENAALAALDLPAAAALVEAKRQAAASLAAAAKAATVPPAAAAAERLRALAAENRTLLERAIAVQGRVIEVIARAVPRALPAPRYGANGGLAAPRQPIAIALSARA